MAKSVKHTFQSAIPDGTTPGMLEPSHWNAEHTITGTEESIVFNTTPAVIPTAVGTLYWDEAHHTLDVITSADTTIQVGQENVVLGLNNTGVTILNGAVVRISGAGTGTMKDRPLISLAQANAENTSYLLGVATQDILNGAEGFVTTLGTVNNVDCSAFATGDLLWLSATVAGGLTATKPNAPNHANYVARALNNKNANAGGAIYVSPAIGYELDELHDVLITTPLNNQVLAYETATALWKNVTLAGSGDVVGPASAVDSNFASFNTTTGKLIKDSGSKAADFATATQGGKADTALQPAAIGVTVQGYNANTTTQGTITLAGLGGEPILTGATADTAPEDADTVYGGNSGSSFATIKTTWTTIKSFLKTYFDAIFKVKHGIESYTQATWDNSTHALTLPACTYWYKGTKVVCSANITCDLDLTADRDHASATLTANTGYFIYFKDATGKMYWSPVAWDLYDKVPVVTVFWNGSGGATIKEYHNETRNISWHINAHNTIGARISSSDFGSVTYTGNATPANVTWSIGGGTLWDEDRQNVIGTTTQAVGARVWQPLSASTATFVDTLYPFHWNGATSKVRYVNASYALTDLTAAQYCVMWAYASPDQDRPFYHIAQAISAPYTSIANARAEAVPNPALLGISNELKLLHRVIVKGDGTTLTYSAASDDFRASAALPGGGTTAPSAAAVTYAPTTPETSANAQSALDNRPNYSALGALSTGLLQVTTGTGALSSTAIGTAGQIPRVNSGATALEYVDGGIDWLNPVAVTDTANLNFGKHHVITVTSADKTMTLPAVSGNGGKLLSIEIAASTTKLITIDGNASETIDGALTRIMWASETCLLLCNGTTWTKVGGKTIPFTAGIYLASTNLLFAAATFTKIPCATKLIGADVAIDLANTRLVAPRTSSYAVSGAIDYNNTNGTGGTNYAICYVNGASVVDAGSGAYRAVSDYGWVLLSGNTFNITKGQTVELYGFFTGGSFTTSSIFNSASSYTNIQINEVISW